jgi:hypothetical protein
VRNGAVMYGGGLILSVLTVSIGHIQAGSATIHFYLVVASLILSAGCLCTARRVAVPMFVWPILLVMAASMPRITGQFGLLQTLYMAVPLMFFLGGLSFGETLHERRRQRLIIMTLTLVASLFVVNVIAPNLLNVSSRPASIFVVTLCLIAVFELRSLWFRGFVIAIATTVLFIGARGAFFAFLVSLMAGWGAQRLGVKGAIAVAGVVALAGLVFSREIAELVFTLPVLRERTFYDGVYNYDALMNLEVNTSGRELAWPYFYELLGSGGWLQLAFGRGPGSASDLGSAMFGAGWAHPHNELLRVAIDYGLLGLVSFAIFWRGVVLRISKHSKDFVPLAIAISTLTALLMLTDNPLVYALYFGNLVLWTLGRAASASVRWRDNPGGSVRSSHYAHTRCS